MTETGAQLADVKNVLKLQAQFEVARRTAPEKYLTFTIIRREGRAMRHRTKRSNKASISPPSVALRLLLTVVASWFAQQAVAQNYPNGLIRIIVPYAAGGVTDSLARIVGAQVADAVGRPVIIENRPGASSMLGMQACANAKPDGYTICVAVADSLSYNPQLFASLPYDPETSFAPVMRLALTNNLLVAKSTASFNNYKELVAYARANPGKLNWATWGPATLPDLYLRWVSMQAGVNIQAIPYKGGAAQANPAVYSGEADVTYMGFGTAAPQIEAGAIKPLVAVGAKRSAFMPELPCLGEEGGDPGLQGYFGLFAPGGTPQSIVQQLNAMFTQAIATPQVRDFYKNSTLIAEPNTPDEFAAFARADREAAAKVFKRMGITPQAAPQ
jgi:tripartite-type tricarboxylate transporter receptor subunit TctC